jgi:hypothetical protein
MNRVIGILLALAPSLALAGNPVAVVQPNSFAQDFADTVKRSQQKWQETAKQQSNSVVPQIIGVVIGVQCGKYTQAVIGYSDGSQRNLATIAQDDATQEQLKMLIAATPNTTVVDLGCSPK